MLNFSLLKLKCPVRNKGYFVVDRCWKLEVIAKMLTKLHGNWASYK